MIDTDDGTNRLWDSKQSILSRKRLDPQGRKLTVKGVDTVTLLVTWRQAPWLLGC
jgi:hypothetical protein